VKLFYENLSAGRESSENKPVEEAFSSQQNPVPIGQDILPTGEQDKIVFKDPYIDPASGDWILNEFDIECIACYRSRYFRMRRRRQSLPWEINPLPSAFFP